MKREDTGALSEATTLVNLESEKKFLFYVNAQEIVTLK